MKVVGIWGRKFIREAIKEKTMETETLGKLTDHSPLAGH